MTGHILCPSVFLGIIAAGATVACSPVDIARQVAMTESKLLICSPDIKALAGSAGALAGLPEDRFTYFGDSEDVELYQVESSTQIHVSSDEHS